MRRTSFAVPIILVFACSTTSWAAPIPGMGSSKLISPELGLYRSAHGFEVNAGHSGWVQSEIASDNAGKSSAIEASYAAPPLEPAVAEALSKNKKNLEKKQTLAGGTAALTIRVDELTKDVSIDRYVARWLKEYPRYGIDVLSSQSFTLDKSRAMMVDLVNRDAGKQIRQAIFLNKRTIAILTCHDRIATFPASVKSCNDIIRTFRWRR
jgi:hypothetical protein